MEKRRKGEREIQSYPWGVCVCVWPHLEPEKASEEVVIKYQYEKDHLCVRLIETPGVCCQH